MTNIEKILKDFEKAKTIKSSWINKYEETAKYIMPSKSNITKDKSYKEKDAQIMTSEAEQSANNFVNRMQQVITPIQTDFIDLKYNDVLNVEKASRDELGKISKIINIYKNASNFDLIISEFYYELILGTACILAQRGDFKTPLIFKTIPFKDYSFLEGANGLIDRVYRNITLKEKEINLLWTDAKYTPTNTKEDKEINLLETVQYNYETKKWDYLIINLENKNNTLIVKREYLNNPFIILRWNKMAGELYGRGVGIIALPSVKSLNKILDYSLRLLAYSLPSLLVKDDGIINPETFRFTPGSLNFVESNLTSDPSITPLQFDTRNDITQYSIDNMTMTVKRIMYDNTIPDNGEAKTATEVAKRIQELNVNLTSMFGRLINELIIPLTKRIVEILQNFNYISKDFDTTQIDNYIIQIQVNSPLALQNKQEELTKIVNTLQILLQFDPTGTAINKYLKINKIIPYMLKLSGIADEFINNDEEIEQIENQMAEAQQQNIQDEMNNQILLSNEIERGKADAKKEL